MSMKFEFDKRIVVTTSILLIAFWLPLTTFAEGLSQSGEFSLVVNSAAGDCPRCQSAGGYLDLRACQQSSDILPQFGDANNQVRKDRVGFSETDPAKQAIRNATASVSEHSQQVYAGFSETDPVNLKSPDMVNFGKTPDGGSPHEYAGFSETTPAANIDRSVEEVHHRAFVNCHDRGDSEMDLGIPEISGPSKESKHHEQS